MKVGMEAGPDVRNDALELGGFARTVDAHSLCKRLIIGASFLV
jgi:hypothetical protein